MKKKIIDIFIILVLCARLCCGTLGFFKLLIWFKRRSYVFFNKQICHDDPAGNHPKHISNFNFPASTVDRSTKRNSNINAESMGQYFCPNFGWYYRQHGRYISEIVISMNIEATLFCILFSAIFFVLGLLYKIISDFRRELRSSIDKLQNLFFLHKHEESGDAYVPRNWAANQPQTNRKPIK